MPKAKKSDMKRALKRAKKIVGSVIKLAEIAGVSRQAVSEWETCPPAHVIAIEKATGVSRHELRPDIYPIE